jgi:4-hydroxy-3-methylbut-2-enyl diphosphate reductase
VKLLLAQPRGMCAGVDRAIQIVERALELHGPPVYVYHEIVHNRRVIADLAARGAIFVESIESIPAAAVTVFSAHGVSNEVRERAREQGLRVIDATCPMVAKVHLEAQRFVRQGARLIVIGHAGHEEVEGTIGSVPAGAYVVGSVADVEALPIAPLARVAYVSQTTLSVDETHDVIEALRRRWPHIRGPGSSDICFATQNRQTAVRTLGERVDVVLVLGARNSSNSNRLREVAALCGKPAYLIDDARDLDSSWLSGARRVGITAGASVPEYLVRELVTRLRELGADEAIELPGPVETVTFRLPDLSLSEPVPAVAFT